jgi:lysophospholipase L1-like esterase
VTARPDRRLHRLAALTLGLLVGLLVAETAVRILDLEARWLPALIYRQGADIEVHQVSDDPGLMYELKPGASVILDRVESWGDPLRVITINRHGFRDPPRLVDKPNGTFRILALGGSNTYGAAVTNGRGWPAALEEALQSHGHAVEVWNMGVSGYVTLQKVRAAELAVERFEPDMLLFQLANQGPRNVLSTIPADETLPIGSVRPLFELDPSLWYESVVHAPRPETAAWALFRRSALLRAGILAADLRLRSGMEPGASVLELDARSQVLGQAAFEAFRREVDDRVHIVVFRPTGAAPPCWLDESDVDRIDLTTVEQKPDLVDIDEIHPGAAVYRWYGEQAARLLIERGWVPEPERRR